MRDPFIAREFRGGEACCELLFRLLYFTLPVAISSLWLKFHGSSFLVCEDLLPLRISKILTSLKL